MSGYFEYEYEAVNTQSSDWRDWAVAVTIDREGLKNTVEAFSHPHEDRRTYSSTIAFDSYVLGKGRPPIELILVRTPGPTVVRVCPIQQSGIIAERMLPDTFDELVAWYRMVGAMVRDKEDN